MLKASTLAVMRASTSASEGTGCGVVSSSKAGGS